MARKAETFGLPLGRESILDTDDATTFHCLFNQGRDRPIDIIRGIRGSNDAFTWGVGNGHPGLETDGVADFCEFPADALYLPPAGSTEMTVEVLLTLTAIVANAMLMETANSPAMNDVDDIFSTRHAAVFKARLGLDLNPGTFNSIIDTAIVGVAGTLYHLRLVADLTDPTKKERFYVQDMAVEAASSNDGPNNGIQNTGGRTLTFGARTGPGGFGAAVFHEARFSSIVRTGEQIIPG